ncbi:peptidase M22 [uncultured Ruminococcus sp.]|uniref:Kae1-like domain-containing protein n=1 Tax=uncultured Ruminococcus sp. TaxID=165186 RepID=UPI002625FF15|nr:peptidase M22 [uncultured Ruminococcus sp.]
MAQILGIDTSNYTTSAAVLDLETGTVHQEKQLLPVKAGAAGLRQSDAVFHHTRQLPELLERLQSRMQEKELCAIGVSSRPRNLEGSYMPCFLTGLGTARSIASVNGLPLHVTSHQIGHVLAALYSAGKLAFCKQSFLAFHVSGGTTDSLYCEPDETDLLRITPCGTSLDLKAGQAIDRVGLMLGMQFPCGAALEQLALQSRKQMRVRPVIRGMDCCLSGLENKCRSMLEQGELPEDIAKFCLLTVAETIIAMTKAAQEKYGALPVIYAGGVMSNRMIRPMLSAQAECYFAEPDCACDNAVGVAVYGALREKRGALWQF